MILNKQNSGFLFKTTITVLNLLKALEMMRILTIMFFKLWLGVLSSTKQWGICTLNSLFIWNRNICFACHTQWLKYDSCHALKRNSYQRSCIKDSVLKNFTKYSGKALVSESPFQWNLTSEAIWQWQVFER